jgi:glycosyltransferase involved in cell wall biosynthesis
VPPGVGILVAPDNPAAFAQALRRVIDDPNERLQLRTAARAAAGRLMTWQVSAQIFSRAVEAVG